MKLENEIEYHYEINTSQKEELLPYVHRYIHFSSSNEKTLQKNLWPSANISLIFNFRKTKINMESCPDIVLVGLHDTIHIMQPDEDEIDTIIVQFSAVGFSAFSNLDTSIITDKIIDAKDVFGDAVQSLFHSIQFIKDTKLRISMLEDFFISLLKNNNKHIPCFAKLAIAIQSDPEYVITESSAISYRHFARIFKQIIGVNIQTYRRLVRFEIAKQLLIDEINNSLTDVGYQSGYYDQAHFAREFKKLSGLRAKYFGPLCTI